MSKHFAFLSILGSTLGSLDPGSSLGDRGPGASIDS